MRERILVVDDELYIRRSIARLLDEAGYEPLLASDGLEAIAAAERVPIDLVIADVRMPGIDGIETIRRIKEIRPEVRSIIITGHGRDETPVEALRLGVNDYILKPFEADVFLHSVERNLAQLRLQRERELLANRLQRNVIAAVETLASALEARDAYTRGHSHRVGAYASWIGERLGYRDDHLESLRHGGLLHDLGKIAVREEVLNKRARLTQEEEAHIRIHSTVGYNILRGIPELEPLLPLVLSHHERLDGSGYPQGLVADRIPFDARLLAVADCFDAVTSSRPYRDGLPLPEAVELLRSQRGTTLEAVCVDALVLEVSARGMLPAHVPVDLTRIGQLAPG